MTEILLTFNELSQSVSQSRWCSWTAITQEGLTVVVEQLRDEVHVGKDHAATAVAFEAELVKGVAMESLFELRYPGLTPSDSR